MKDDAITLVCVVVCVMLVVFSVIVCVPALPNSLKTVIVRAADTIESITNARTRNCVEVLGMPIRLSVR
jgi:hypothetical protein